jgi:hypothetical protein
MTTPFSLLCHRCGLSRAEAARFLEVDEATVEGWDSGKVACPDGFMAQMRLLYRQISAIAEQAMQHFVNFSKSQGAPAEVELGAAATDADAQRLGLPCVGAHHAVLGMVIARAHGTRFVLVAQTPAEDERQLKSEAESG